MKTYRILSWSRDGKGKVIDRPMREVCNAVTTFCGRGIEAGGEWKEMGNTTPYVLEVEEEEVVKSE